MCPQCKTYSSDANLLRNTAASSGTAAVSSLQGTATGGGNQYIGGGQGGTSTGVQGLRWSYNKQSFLWSPKSFNNQKSNQVSE